MNTYSLWNGIDHQFTQLLNWFDKTNVTGQNLKAIVPFCILTTKSIHKAIHTTSEQVINMVL